VSSVVLLRLPSWLSSKSTSKHNLRSVNVAIELLLREALTLRALKVERSGTTRRNRLSGANSRCVSPGVSRSTAANPF
jgi:hypothetical protein